MTDQKTSLLIPSQLPEFVRDNPDYSNFVLFLQAYYEWMEQNGNVTDDTKNLLNYADIDNTSAEFIKYFTNDFLPYFPEDALVDKQKAIKVAKQLYSSKGTPASYQFLFRTLYDSDFEVFYTRDAVLRASDGVWYVAKALMLASDDVNLLNINNYRLFGETTKSIATVENSVKSGFKTEVFISNIERLFQSGEFVRVVDNNNQDVLFNGQPLRAKVVGQISQLNINPKYRGLLYQPGDPVIVYDGLNSPTGLGAIAEVGDTTTGLIQRINVLTEGYGYTNSPGTTINFTNAPGATAVVGSLNPAANGIANVAMIPSDSIALKRFITIGNTNYNFSNIEISNATTTLANAFTFESFTTYPLSSILVTNGGGGITQVPSVTAIASYPNDAAGNPNLKSLGILAPIQIISGGEGYEANDTIVFTGGSGYGAFANVESVAANGQILSIKYVPGDGMYALGGMGYRADVLPSLTIESANVSANGADIFVPGILGDGATFSTLTDRVGAVSTINILNYGEDYISTPNVSLKVQDVVVTGIDIQNITQRGDIVYQGNTIELAAYIASVNSISLLIPNSDPLLSLYNLRVYNYNSKPVHTLPLKVNGKNIEMAMANFAYDDSYDEHGVKTYGDGTAKATAKFLNGLTISQGQYLNTRGQPSSYNVLEDETYNNYTYQITVGKEIEKYRDILLNLLHPTGMKVLGRYALKSDVSYNYHGLEALNQGYTLQSYTGYPGSSVTMVADFENKSNNILQFENLAGAELNTFVFEDSIVEVTTENGPNIRSGIVSIDNEANTITLSTNTWLTFANVANIQANSGTNMINILSLTGLYDYINNANYSDPAYPLKDIVFAGDKVLIANNTEQIVESVDYINGIIYLTGTLTDDALSTLAVNRTINTTGVKIFGPVGTQYVPQLVTQDGQQLITEDDKIILLG